VKLLCIIDCNQDLITGYAESKEEYFGFVLHKGSEAVIDGRFPKRNYRSYRHFVLISGKFDPYAFFLKKPIRIPALHFDLLTELYQNTPALRVWG
jgi:hypothetical protein